MCVNLEEQLREKGGSQRPFHYGTAEKRRKGQFGSGNQDSSGLPSSLLSFTTATQTNPDLISHEFISSFQFLFSSTNICTNKPLQFVYINRVSWVDDGIMQKVNGMSVITSRITVPPELCSTTEQVSV